MKPSSLIQNEPDNLAEGGDDVGLPEPKAIEGRAVIIRRGQEVAPYKACCPEADKFGSCQWERIFNTVAYGMRIVDLGGRVLGANDAFCRLVGVEKEEILGRPCYEYFPGPARNTDACPLKRIAGGEDSIELEADKERPDGSIMTCRVSATALRDHAGTLIGIIESYTDITESRQALKMLCESQELIEAQFRNSPAIILIIDRNHKLLRINKVKAGPHNTEELIGLDAVSLLPPEHQDVVREAIERCFTTCEH